MKKYLRTYNDFIEWIGTLDQKTLTVEQQKILNEIVTNFDTIFEKKSAGGSRNIYLSSLIRRACKEDDSKKIVLPSTVSAIGSVNSINRLVKLNVESFRGFKNKRTINFDKKYIFAFGRNGSGKSSLCESLEYSLLGYITEAIERRIDVAKYIKNSSTGKAVRPELIGIDSSGGEVPVTPDINSYKACFVEKNRIDKFSRISAHTNSDQSDLIAMLFGLDEFDDFVENFSDDISTYLCSTVKSEQLSKKNDELKGHQQIIAQYPSAIDGIKTEKEKLVEDTSIKTDFDSLDLYLHGEEDGDIGEIAKIEEKIAKISDVNHKFISAVVLLVKSQKIISFIDTHNALLKEFESKKASVSFRNLYEAALEIKSINESKCPLCETPLEKTVSDPYKKASDGLIQLGEIAKLETKITESKSDILKEVRILVSALKNWQDLSVDLDLMLPLFSSFDFHSEEFENIEFKAGLKLMPNVAGAFIKCWKTFLDAEIKILVLNRDATKSLQEKDTLVTKKNDFKKISDFIKEIRHNEKFHEKQKKDSENFIKTFKQANKDLIEQAEAEALVNKKLASFSDAYLKLVSSLKSYKNNLPSRLVKDLSQLTLELYNIINEHDKEFEKLAKIKLPCSPNEGIKIWFQNDPAKEEDAMHILSEGHIRCLGLAILIAKNIQDDMPFIVFDDAVNAIDDDHRGGIRKLLFKNDQLEKKQIIVTSHAEEFINDSCHDFTKKELDALVSQIIFYTGDERGVNIDSDDHHYLSIASANYDKGKYRDTLENCRRSLENISDRLWAKIKNDGCDSSISMTVIYPGKSFFLMTKIQGLIKNMETITKRLGTDRYSDELKELGVLTGLNSSQSTYWNYLNEGTHDLLDQIEFDPTVVRSILDSLLSLESMVTSRPKKAEDGIDKENIKTGGEQRPIKEGEKKIVDASLQPTPEIKGPVCVDE